MERGKPFTNVRKQHLEETAEDYTELIDDLIEQKGEARICDIARHMGVSHVTALKIIRRLTKEGFLETAPHQPIFLTDKGKKLAAASKERHLYLLDFLISLGVSRETAVLDVEGMEHHISLETLEAIKKFLQTKRT